MPGRNFARKSAYRHFVNVPNFVRNLGVMSVIQTFNGLAETDVIHDGQVLLIPEPTLSGEIPEDRIPKGVTPAAPVGDARRGNGR